MHFISAAHQLAWTQYPAIWLIECCAIFWLVLRSIRSLWARAGVLMMICGLAMNALVTDANAGTMPVVDMPSHLRPVSPMWHAATAHTRLSWLADQARFGLFSVGDFVLLFGGALVLAICVRRALRRHAASRGLSFFKCEEASALQRRFALAACPLRTGELAPLPSGQLQFLPARTRTDPSLARWLVSPAEMCDATSRPIAGTDVAGQHCPRTG